MEDGPKSLDEVDPELLRTYEKLGIPLQEQEVLAGVRKVAVDAVFDSVSVGTTFREELAKAGVIFVRFLRLSRTTPTWCANIWAQWCRNRIIISPRLTRRCFPTVHLSISRRVCACPMELSTYFRINEANTVSSSARWLLPTAAAM